MEVVERRVRGLRYRMPLHLAAQFDELERVKNLIAFRPPQASFADVLLLEHECENERRYLAATGFVTQVDCH
jgi:hypothetical protein